MNDAMTDIIFVYVTHPDSQAAQVMSRTLVEHGLAACVNMLRGMQTIYRWEGRIEAGEEVVMIVKTRADLLDALQRAIRAAHPYACPCIVALPIRAGEPGYLNWIGQSCGPAPDGASRP